MSLDSD